MNFENFCENLSRDFLYWRTDKENLHAEVQVALLHVLKQKLAGQLARV